MNLGVQAYQQFELPPNPSVNAQILSGWLLMNASLGSGFSLAEGVSVPARFFRLSALEKTNPLSKTSIFLLRGALLRY
jgi:hypothetical protein